MKPSAIRNFCIIAHIDHGKTTLADRVIELTSTVPRREMHDQLLDSMDIERERGITVKLQTVRMIYRSNDGLDYQFNLVDTPGHVDFSAEVSRSLAACEGAILLVDATQGVQAQTIANLRLAQKRGMKILPVVNKIDSPQADVGRVLAQLSEIEGVDIAEHFCISARTGKGVNGVLEYIANYFPEPASQPEAPLRALVFDSHYDVYQGAVMHVRIIDGQVDVGQKIKFMSSEFIFEVAEVGAFMPHMLSTQGLNSGEVGYISAGLKEAGFVRMGDTLTSQSGPALEPVERYQEIKPMVFCGLYPDLNETVKGLRGAIQKLVLNDAALHVEPEVSESMGAGFRCGFLGMLHMEIVQERLKREYGITVIATAPSVVYRAWLKNGRCVEVDNPALFPRDDVFDYVEEPYVKGEIITPNTYAGAVMELCSARRGEYIDLAYVDNNDILISYEIPLSEMAFGFFDELKSLTHGYASFDYEFSRYKVSELVRVNIHLDSKIVDAFAFIAHKDKAYARAAEMVKKLKYVIPRKLYPVPAQASVGNKIIAREDIPPLRKSALAQGFQGSISQKNRLIRKQRESKRHSNGVSKSEIPKEAFMAILAIK